MVIPAVTRVQSCNWRRRVVAREQVADLSGGGTADYDPIGLAPGINAVWSSGNAVEQIIFHFHVPPDGDLAVDWVVKFSSVPNTQGFAGDFTLDLDLYIAAAGEDLEMSGGITAPDATLTATAANGTDRGAYNSVTSATLPANTLDANSFEVFIVMHATAVETPGSYILVPSMWLEYETEAATITVT